MLFTLNNQRINLEAAFVALETSLYSFDIFTNIFNTLQKACPLFTTQKNTLNPVMGHVRYYLTICKGIKLGKVSVPLAAAPAK